MDGRYMKLRDGEGNIHYYSSRDYVYLEFLDRRSPLFNFSKYRINIGGPILRDLYIDWMHESFGHPMSYERAVRAAKYGDNFGDTKWVVRRKEGYTARYEIYFADECESLIMLRFK